MRLKSSSIMIEQTAAIAAQTVKRPMAIAYDLDVNGPAAKARKKPKS